MKEKVRVSIGTLKVLGMELLETDVDTRTAYLQTYHPEKCIANCKFCAQARKASSRMDNIARGLYPVRETDIVISRIARAYKYNLLKRVCIQTMNYGDMFSDLIFLIKEIKKISEIPISVGVYPLSRDKFVELKNLGIDKIVIPLDAVTEDIFDRIKGRRADSIYEWHTHMNSLLNAVDIFGRYNVGTHLIIGLGETEKDAVEIIQRLWNSGIYSAIFAYTPIPNTQLYIKSPEIGHYRRIQIATYLIENELSEFGRMKFKNKMIIDFGVGPKCLEDVINSGKPFITKGCPDCNRPYSTESPGGLIYNYPRMPTNDEIKNIKLQIYGR